MTQDSAGPLHRPVSVLHLPPEGADVTVEATAAEREVLAQDFGLPAIRSLVGRFHLAGTPQRVEVTGRVAAEIAQTCVITLDVFDAAIDEEVAVDFVAPDARAPARAEDDDTDVDELVNGQIDLGALTAEFLALGLDPYPRKPGAAFQGEPAGDAPASPFQALKRLTSPE